MLPEWLVTAKRLQSAVAQGDPDEIDMKKHGNACYSEIMFLCFSVYLECCSVKTGHLEIGLNASTGGC